MYEAVWLAIPPPGGNGGRNLPHQSNIPKGCSDEKQKRHFLKAPLVFAVFTGVPGRACGAWRGRASAPAPLRRAHGPPRTGQLKVPPINTGVRGRYSGTVLRASSFRRFQSRLQ